MTLSRILGGVGRVMVALGVLLLAFVAFQLWGTGYQTDQAQARLDAEFRDRLAAYEAAGRPTPTVSTPASSSTTTAAPTTTTTEAPGTTAGDADGATATTRDPALPPPVGDPDDPNVARDGGDLTFRRGEAVGRIAIPKIGSDFVIVEGVELSLLGEGPGHFPNTPLPGQPGNAAIAGHRVTYKAPFNRIDEMAPGDQITVTTLQGEFTYEVLPQEAPDGSVRGWYLVTPSDVSILADKGQNLLTLMACHPKYDLSQRIVVHAKLVDDPAPSTFRPQGDYQLPSEDVSGTSGAVLVAGDPAARLPAALFSLAALAVAALAWYAGRRWKRWPAYLIAAPFVVVLLWFAFEFINRSLPGAY